MFSIVICSTFRALISFTIHKCNQQNAPQHLRCISFTTFSPPYLSSTTTTTTTPHRQHDALQLTSTVTPHTLNDLKSQDFNQHPFLTYIYITCIILAEIIIIFKCNGVTATQLMQEHMLLLDSCLQTSMTYTIAECTVNKLLMMDRRTVRNM
jgi:hypothetical protein